MPRSTLLSTPNPLLRLSTFLLVPRSFMLADDPRLVRNLCDMILSL